jgi:hypothetical protein
LAHSLFILDALTTKYKAGRMPAMGYSPHIKTSERCSSFPLGHQRSSHSLLRLAWACDAKLMSPDSLSEHKSFSEVPPKYAGLCNPFTQKVLQLLWLRRNSVMKNDFCKLHRQDLIAIRPFTNITC